MPRKSTSKQTRGVVNAVARILNSTSTNQTKSNKRQQRRRRRNISTTRLAATQRQRVTTRAGSKNSTVITGSEVVNSIPFFLSDSNDEAIFSVIPANPCYWKGTNIAQQAANYSAYRPLQWSYTYIPQVSVNHNGIVQAGTLWDAVVSRDALSQTLMTSPGGALSQVWSKFGRRVNLRGLQQKLYNCNGELAQSTNPFLFVAYNRGATKLDGTDDYVIPGTFVIHYKYLLTNKLGASNIYGRTNNFVWATGTLDKTHAHMSFVVRTGKLPPLTVLDIDNGKLLNHGTEINGESLVGDVYWNDPSVNETEGIMVGGDETLQYLTDLQYTNDPDDGWVTVDKYYGPMSYEMTYGLPGTLTVMVSPTALLGNQHSKGSVAITAWIGTRKLDKTASGIFTGGYFCYIPYTSSTYVRGVSSLGKHSNWLYFNYTWTTALQIRDEPPEWVMCPPWAGAKLEDHNPEPETDAPTEDTYPNGLPVLDPSIIPNPTPVTLSGYTYLLPQTTQIIQPGTHYVIRANGIVPYIMKRFVNESPILYDPTVLSKSYFVVDDEHTTIDSTLIQNDYYLVYGHFPAIYDTGISPTDFTAVRIELTTTPPENPVWKTYYLNPIQNTGEISIIAEDAEGITDQQKINPIKLLEPKIPTQIMAQLGSATYKSIKIDVVLGEYTVIQTEFNVIPNLDGGFYAAQFLGTPSQPINYQL